MEIRLKAYYSFKADEWKHWTLIFSLYCLKGLIPEEHYIMWTMFVGACTKVCRRSITVEEVNDAHNTFKMFCLTFERLFGKYRVKPNMHMLLHLKDCILDFGPVYSFWCFGFERYNGILGAYHLNNHNIAATIMRKFLTSSHIKNVQKQHTSEKDFMEIFPNKENLSVSANDLESLSIIHNNFNLKGVDLLQSNLVTPLSSIEPIAFQNIIYLERLFEVLFPEKELVRISKSVGLLKKVMLGNDIFVSGDHEFQNSPNQYVFARWVGESYGMNSIIVRPAVISQILYVKFITKNTESSDTSPLILFIAHVKWLKEHIYRQFYSRRSDSIAIWSTEYLNLGPCSFIPLQFIRGNFTFVKKLINFTKYHSDEVNIVVPLPSKSFS